jgi:hypothetical protein
VSHSSRSTSSGCSDWKPVMTDDTGNDDYLASVKEARRERNFRCAFCGWTVSDDDVSDYTAWKALDRHDREEHPGRSWADWSDEGAVRYVAGRSWK